MKDVVAELEAFRHAAGSAGLETAVTLQVEARAGVQRVVDVLSALSEAGIPAVYLDGLEPPAEETAATPENTTGVLQVLPRLREAVANAKKYSGGGAESQSKAELADIRKTMAEARNAGGQRN